MELTDLLPSDLGSSLAVVVFVVSSTLGVGLSLTVGQILAPLKNARLVALSLAANFVLAPMAALEFWRAALGLDEPLGIGLLLCGLAAGAPFLTKLAEFAKADLAVAVGLMVLLMVVTVGYLPLALPFFLAGTTVNGTVKLVSCLVAAKIGGRDRCIVVPGTPVPAGDHRPLLVAVSPVPCCRCRPSDVIQVPHFRTVPWHGSLRRGSDMPRTSPYRLALTDAERALSWKHAHADIRHRIRK